MENRIIFREMLSEIKAASDVYGGRISKGEIREILSGMPLTEEHFALIYEYLAGQNIRVTEDRAEQEGSGFTGETYDGNDMQVGRTAGKTGIYGTKMEQDAGKSAPGSTQRTMAGTDDESGGLGAYLRRLIELAEESFEDEHALIGRVMRGDEAAKARLIESYLPLIGEAAGNFESEAVLIEDLIQEGNLGLLEALDSLGQFDSPAACSAHILNSINEAMAHAVTNSREKQEADGHIVSRVNHLNEAVKNLERDLEHKVTAEELSAYLEMPLQEIRDILRMSGDQIELDGESR